MSASFKNNTNAFREEVAPALAFFELSSISRGLFLTDAILKKAPVRVLTSQPISSGKHALLFMGDVASVQESAGEAQALSDGTVLQSVLIPAVHTGLVPFLDSLWKTDEVKNPFEDAVGIVESKTLAAAVLAADAALKTSNVRLCRFRLGQGIGGRAFFVLTGKQDEVEASLEVADSVLVKMESQIRKDIIARPSDEALVYF